jgi:hypothetical protein
VLTAELLVAALDALPLPIATEAAVAAALTPGVLLTF